jgi:hypothetical protein
MSSPIKQRADTDPQFTGNTSLKVSAGGCGSPLSGWRW